MLGLGSIMTPTRACIVYTLLAAISLPAASGLQEGVAAPPGSAHTAGIQGASIVLFNKVNAVPMNLQVSKMSYTPAHAHFSYDFC